MADANFKNNGLHCSIFSATASAENFQQIEALNKEKSIMKKMFYILFTIFALLASSMSYADTAEKLQAQSGWTNQSGSTLYIESIGSNGQLTGTYINRAQGYKCQNIAYPVTGWIYGTAITFTTKWQSTTESCSSITAWTGFLYQGQIKTLWQMSLNGSSNTNQIIQGSDTFYLQNTVTHKSMKPE